MQSINALDNAPWRYQTSWLDNWDLETAENDSVEASKSLLGQLSSPSNSSSAAASRIHFEGQVLSVCDLSPDLDIEDVRQCIMRMGVSPHRWAICLSLYPSFYEFKASIKSVTMTLTHGEASIHFKHPHVAKAVAAMLQNYPTLLWGSKIAFDHSSAASQRCTAQCIDLTAEERKVSDKSTQSLYQGYDLDAYEDNMSTESDSDSGQPSGIAQSSSRDTLNMSPENTNKNFFSLLSTHLTKTFEPSFPQPGVRLGVINPEKDKEKTLKATRLSRFSMPLVQSPTAWRRKTIKLPQTPYNKARRILLPSDLKLPILTVSMRADIHFFDRLQRYRVSALSSGNSSDSRRVVDALMINDVACIGYNKGPCQLSLVRMDKQGGPFTLVDLDHRPHTLNTRSGANTDQGSISCLTAKGSRKDAIELFTGGYDKVIRLWSVTDSNIATSEEIMRTMTIPDALILNNSRLLIATSSRLVTVDLGHLTARPTTARFSNLVHQMHVSRLAPNVIVMEVKHLEYQFEIFDDRIGRGFNRVPDCHFGYRGKGGSLSRFSRGDINGYAFVKGYDDGTLCRWDFRNLRTPALDIKEVDFDPIVHTVFNGPEIITYGKSSLTFLTGN
ncbi:hypothetical protein BJ165DRAFT_1521108 [Panaeolus papilionaceus]|nr:hypothetical protein BJ165DRAFT_1521108 [Panaeolus papilionaceus]